MRIALFAFVSLFLSSAFALEKVQHEFRHHDSGMDGFSKNYYSCEFAEEALENYLETLGAVDTKVRCSGGIQPGGWSQPITLKATFATFVSADGRYQTWRSERLNSRFGSESSCFFHTKLLDNLLPTLSHVRVESKLNNCVDNRSRWSYEVSIGQ